MITALFDIEESLTASGRQYTGGAIKTWEDLARYEAVLDATKPELVVECGTYHGGSAVWFAEHDLDVITIDIVPRYVDHPQVTFLLANSTARWVVDTVTKMAAGRKTMVVLDSDHSAHHVADEIRCYGPLVTPGCYLVVEDGIVRWMSGLPYDGSPLDAIETMLEHDPDWLRDETVETMFPVTMFPAGWWQRRETF
jgi:cephalosporin hydroxylase